MPSFIIGFYFYSKFFMAKQTASMGAKTAEQLFKNEKIKGITDKIKLVEEQIDIKTIMKDYQNFKKHLDEVDWSALAETIKSFRVAIEIYNSNQRDIPKPD